MKFRIQVFGYECVLKCLSISDKEVGLVKKINDPWEIEQQFFDCSEIIYETSSLFFDENIYFKILDKDGFLLDSFNSYKIDAIGDVVGDDNFGYEDVDNDDVNNHQARSEILERIKLLTLKTTPEWTYSGVSVLRTEYVRYMVRDNFLFLPPIAILLICILSFLFKNWVNVFLPILTVLITVVWLLGFMGLVGLDINIMTYIVPTLLFIIGIGDAIHIQAYFREKLCNKKLDPVEAMHETITQMFKVIFLTSITTLSLIHI